MRTGPSPLGGLRGSDAGSSLMSMRRQEGREEVDEREQHVYRAWLNWKLAQLAGARKVTALLDDLADGVALCQLATVLVGLKAPPRFNPQPAMMPQMIDNASVALRLLTDNGYSKPYDAKIFASKDQRMVLGFLWQLIENEAVVTRYKLRKSQARESGTREDEKNPRRDILQWTAQYVAGYPGVPADVATLGARAFRDGRVLNFMLHKARPDAVVLADMEMQQPAERIKCALLSAHKELRVPMLVSPDSLLDPASTDKGLLTYLFAFRSCVEAATDNDGAAHKAPAAAGSGASQRPETRAPPTSGRGKTIRGDPRDANSASIQTMQCRPEDATQQCPVCEKKLSGTLVKVLPQEVLYHQACFVCRTCSKVFERYYWPFEALPYCFDHFLDAAELKCVKCTRSIREQCVVARGAKYHAACFVCTECGKQFDRAYNLFEGRPYCDQHYANVAGVTCTACGLAVDDQPIKAISGLWHKRCFVCCKCDTAILQPDGKPIPFFAMEGEPVCEPCNDDMTAGQANVCAKCSKPVHKGIVSAMGKKWCNTCFACTKCAELLTHSFFNVDGKPYCDTCAGSL